MKLPLVTRNIALCGSIFSGKTTVSRMLEAYHGYTLINYTDYLKKMAATSLSLFTPTTVDDILNDKEKYRAFLQEFGTLIGFNTEPKYVLDVLPTVEPVVFDNVRTKEQWLVLKDRGFRLVYLTTPLRIQRQRADHMGIDRYTLEDMKAHSIESGVESFAEDIWQTYDTGENTAEELATMIASEQRQGDCRPDRTPRNRGAVLLRGNVVADRTDQSDEPYDNRWTSFTEQRSPTAASQYVLNSSNHVANFVSEYAPQAPVRHEFLDSETHRIRVRYSQDMNSCDSTPHPQQVSFDGSTWVDMPEGAWEMISPGIGRMVTSDDTTLEFNYGSGSVDITRVSPPSF